MILSIYGEPKSSKKADMKSKWNHVFSSRNDCCKNFQFEGLFLDMHNVLIYDRSVLSCEMQVLDRCLGSHLIKVYFIANISMLNNLFENLRFIQHTFTIVGEHKFIRVFMDYALHMYIIFDQQGFFFFFSQMDIIA